MRAVLDPNVIVSALLSPSGAPAALFREWVGGAFELVVSPALLAELERVLSYPKVATRVSPEEARQLLELLRSQAVPATDPVDAPTVGSPDPDDDYLIALAESVPAVLVSGDTDLHGLAGQIPTYRPREFLDLLERS